MPTSRNRQGHHPKRRTDLPSKTKTKGRTTLAILFGAFGILVSLFAGSGMNWIYMLIGALAGSTIGYFMGKSMEKEATSR